MGCCGSKGDVNADPDLVPLAAEPALRSGSGPAVSREWAEAALRRSGALAEDASLVAMAEAKMMVTNMEGNELEDGGGLSGPKIIKLRMTFSSNAPADLPNSMICKWGSYAHFTENDLGIRLYIWFAALKFERVLRCESSVYRHRELLQQAGINVPRCFYTGDSYPKDPRGEPSDANICCYICGDRRTSVRTVQLMEDLGDKYEPGPTLHHIPDERAAAIFSNVAKLHVWGWGKSDARPIPATFDLSPHVAMFAGFADRQRKMVAKIGNGKTAEKYIGLWQDYETLELDGSRAKVFVDHPEYIAMFRELVQTHAHWHPKAEALWPTEAGAAKPVGATIIHGDCHQWNHLFRKEPDASLPELVLIDWQFTGGGHLAWEVCYALNLSRDFTSVDADVALLRPYHTQLMAGLAAAGVEAEYSWDTFYADVLLSMITTCCAFLINWSKFLNPDACEKMLADPKARELVLLAMVVRNRLCARIQAHIITNPAMREVLLGGALAPATDESHEVDEDQPLMKA